MKKKNTNSENRKGSASLRNKELIMLVLIILLFILIRFALLYIGAWLDESRENELIQLKMSVLTNIMSDTGRRHAAAEARVLDRMAAETELMTTMLREFCTEDGDYTGPLTFRHGFVAELRGDRVNLPPGILLYEPQITSGMIEDELRVRASGSSGAPLALQSKNDKGNCRVYFGEIAGGYVFVNVLNEDEYAKTMERYSSQTDKILENADDNFGGMTLLIREQDGGFQVIRRVGKSEDYDALTDEVIRQCITHAASVITLNEKEYNCAVSQIDDSLAGERTDYILQIIPKVSLSEQNASQALIVVLLMIIIIIAVTVYVISVQKLRADGRMSSVEDERYQPNKVRRQLIAVGILSVLIVFVVAVFIESLGQMYMELRYGRDTLRLFAGQIERGRQEQTESISRARESWYVDYGEEMAALISVNPGLATPDKLRTYCRILDIDYIMLFDQDGNESACSRDYVGFTLNSSGEKEPGALSDFGNLLYGVDSIVHEPSVEPKTKLERQLIGVKVPASEPGKMHGALIMAVMPERDDGSASAFAKDRTLAFKTARGTKCMAANTGTGEILYASAASMLGKTIVECGLPEKSLQDGYMDFTSIGGTDVLVITVREGDCVYYYAVESMTMFERVMQYGILFALLFGLILALLIVYLLSGTNEKPMEQSTGPAAYDRTPKKHLKTDERNAVIIVQDMEPEMERGERKGILTKILAFFSWYGKTPGQKAAFVIRLGLVVLILCCLDVLGGKTLISNSYESLLGFLLHGDWMRGLNLFSLCSCLLVIAIGYMINLLASLLLKVTDILFSGHTETICHLLYSCVKYVTIIGILYFCMEYLGFPTSTILTAFASVSLAFSLGAQDLIKDILAGLSIGLDGSFGVGDVVEINQKRGMVLEIGVRATRLRLPINNIYVIDNHKITDVLNLSKEYSETKIDIRVSMKCPLENLKEILNRELPAIGEKDERILYGPYLIGLTALPRDSRINSLITLSIGAMNEEKNTYEVTCFLNEELKLLAEREGIELL